MPGINQKYLDEILGYQLDLRRLEAGTRKDVLKTLVAMQKEIVTKLSGATPLTEFTKVRQAELLRQVNAIVSEYYSKAQADFIKTTDTLAQTQADHLAKSMDKTLLPEAAIVLPTATTLARVVGNVAVEGGPLSDWWGKLSSDTSFKLSNAIRQGAIQGETNQQIISRVTGKAGQPGILEVSRRNAAAVVQTAMQTIANDSHLKLLEQNEDVAPKIRFLTTFDSHTCSRCMSRAGLEWETVSKDPVGHSIPFENPPIHVNCRCVLVGVTLTYKELGSNLPEPKIGTRASSEGQIRADTTASGFFSRQSKAIQDEQLGVGRAQLFRDKKITLNDLIDGKGRELTLAQLKSKYD